MRGSTARIRTNSIGRINPLFLKARSPGVACRPSEIATACSTHGPEAISIKSASRPNGGWNNTTQSIPTSPSGLCHRLGVLPTALVRTRPSIAGPRLENETGRPRERRTCYPNRAHRRYVAGLFTCLRAWRNTASARDRSGSVIASRSIWIFNPA